MQITVTLTDEQAQALATQVLDVGAHAQHVVEMQAERALDAIVQSETSYLIRADEAVPAGRAAILASAVAGGRAPSAQEKVDAMGRSAADTFPAPAEISGV